MPSNRSIIRELGELLLAIVFCGLTSAIVTSLLLTLLLPIRAGDVHRLSDVPLAFLAMFVTACFPAGAFGACCGLFGGVYLRLRRSKLHSQPRLMVEVAAFGVILSMAFPIFMSLIFGGPVGEWARTTWMTLSALVGLIVSVLYTALYRRVVLNLR